MVQRFCSSHIALLFSSMLNQGHSPKDFLAASVVPIPKDARRSIYVSSNYRGIALSSIFGRIFDLIIIDFK